MSGQHFVLLFEQPSDHCSTGSSMLKSPNEKEAERPLTRASSARGFSGEVIESELSRRSAVRSSVWLDVSSIHQHSGRPNSDMFAATPRTLLLVPPSCNRLLANWT